MNKKYLFALILPLFFGLQACNHSSQKNSTGISQDSTSVGKTGLVFIKSIEEASQAEIKAATVAEANSKNPRVTTFAQKVISNFNGSLQKLQDLKAKASVTTTGDEINIAHKKFIDSISKLSGTQFDQAYMKAVVDHSGKMAVLYVNASQDNSRAISIYTRKVMPTLQIQLDSARKISASLK